MIYTAPRQIIFAVIILISFSLHSLFLVYSTENQIAEAREKKGERILTELIDDSAVALSYTDRVSLGVIAKRYAGEYDVTRLIILDINEKILVQTGDAPMQDGKPISKVATHKNVVVGTAIITMKATSKSEIVKELWQFILFSLFTHLFIWMSYSLVARPTKEQIKMLSNDIHEHYFAHYHLEAASNQKEVDSVHSMTSMAQKDTERNDENNKEKGGILDYLTGRFIKDNTKEQINNVKDDVKNVNSIDTGSKLSTSAENSVDTTKVAEEEPFTRTKLTDDITSFLSHQNIQTSNAHKTEQKELHPEALTNSFLKKNLLNNHFSNKTDKSAESTSGSFSLATKNDAIDELEVNIQFVDPHELVEKLSDEISIPYYQLCTQLLNYACDELLKQEFLQGVSLHARPIFSKHGTSLILTSTDEKKLILAAPLLAELYQILNGILYEKHRELRRFSLPIAIGITIPENSDNLSKFIKRFTEAHDIVLLLSSVTIDYLKGSMNFSNISHPRSVLERECVYLDDVDLSLQKILFKVRNRVLEGG